MRHPIRLLSSLFGLTMALSAQTTDKVALLEGSRPGDLQLRILAESNPSQPGSVFLDQLSLLPFEITCRTKQMEFVPGRARRVPRSGWPHVALPNGGKLFHYRRGGPTTEFGFLLIAPSGDATIIHSLRAGSGANPYEDPIAVAPDGRHACIATKLGALHLARLDGKTFSSSSLPTRRLALPSGVQVETGSIFVGKSHVFFVTEDDRIRRCDLSDRNQPQDLTPASSGNVRLKDELAPSGDSTAVAFLYGPKDFYSIYLLRSTGPAIKLPPRQSKYEEPGYLPQEVGGPRMLLNDDGSRLMYTDSAIRDEIYLLDTTGRTTTTHITSDPNFQPYIGVGILPTFAAINLVIAIGDPARHDWYMASTNSPAVVNLTKTGSSNRPFNAGQLDPSSAFRAGDGSLMATERVAGGHRFRYIDTRTNQSRVLPARAEMRMGSSLAGQHTVLAPSQLGDLLIPLGGTGSIIQGPPGVHLSEQITSASGAFSIFHAQDAMTPGNRSLPIAHLHGLGLELLSPIDSLRQLVLTRAGGALINGRQLAYVDANRNVTLPGAPLIRIVLSGAATQ